MNELRVITIPFDPWCGVFDDGNLREYLADRDVLRYESGFCVHTVWRGGGSSTTP